MKRRRYKSNIDFTIILLISLTLHFFVLTVMFVKPNAAPPEEYQQVRVKLGIKKNIIRPSAPIPALTNLPDIEPSAGNDEQAILGNSDIDAKEVKAADTAPSAQQEAKKATPKPNKEIAMADIAPPMVGSGHELTAKPAPKAESKKAKQVASTSPALFMDDDEGVVIGNATSGNASKIAKYEQMLPLWLNKFKKIPEEGKNGSFTGSGEIFIKIDRNGKILLWKIIRSTGNHVFDEALQNMIAAADPVLPVPASYYPDKKTFSYKIEFDFKN